MKTMKGIVLIIVLLFTMILAGCWDSRELNVLAITVCIGIDKADDGYMVTEQVLNPKVIASKKSVNEPAVILYKEKGKDLFEILRRMTLQIDRKIYNAHMRLVVLGEEVAKDNINSIIDFLARDHEFRTDFCFAVAKDTTANNVLSTLSQLQSVSGVEIFQSIQVSEGAWAPTKEVQILELLNAMLSDGKEPVMTGIEVTDGQNETNTIEALKSTDVKNKSKLSGLAVFRDNKLVGWLNEDESRGYNYIIGNVKNTVGYSQDYGSKITFELTSEKSKISAYKLEGKLAIKVDIKAEANVGTSDESLDVSKKENVDKLSEIAENEIKDLCKESLKKIQEKYESDVFGFGEVVHRTYPKEWKKLKDNWNKEFETLPVDVNVKVKINRLGQISKSYFIKEKD